MSGTKRVLLADADLVLRASLAEQLVREGAYAIAEAANAGEARNLAEAPGAPFAFMVLGADLPDATGEALAMALRARGIACPILLLGAGSEETLPEGVGRIAMPFRFAALMARLHTLQGGQGGEAGQRIGPYMFHPNAKTLEAGGRAIRLTEKETEILKFLRAAGGVVPRRTLLHEVWRYSPTVTTHTLETHIYRLRRKLEDGVLVTEEGGYRLNT